MIIGCFAWFEKDGKILLQLRKWGDELAGKWAFPGGGKEAGENTYECVVREVLEETSIQIDEAHLFHVHETTYEGQEILMFIWHITSWRWTPNINEPEEAESYEWHSLSNLPSNTVNNIDITIDAVQKQKYYSQS